MALALALVMILVLVIIKSMNMRKYGYILFLFLLMKSLNAFVEARQPAKDKDFMRIAKTNDLLYISDSIVYLMSKSPLEAFPGYKDVYASYKLNNYAFWHMPYGIEVGRHPAAATYQVIWCLRDSILYLSDIFFYNVEFCKYKSVFPNNEQYKLMEELTEVKFDKTQSPLSGNPFRHRNTIGMMPATWSNDTILIKLSRGQDTKGKGQWQIYCEDLNDTIVIKRSAPLLDLEKWRMTPTEELIFRNGKLISRETKDIY
jgi:hypothetical protein